MRPPCGGNWTSWRSSPLRPPSRGRACPARAYLGPDECVPRRAPPSRNTVSAHRRVDASVSPRVFAPRVALPLDGEVGGAGPDSAHGQIVVPVRASQTVWPRTPGENPRDWILASQILEIREMKVFPAALRLHLVFPVARQLGE